MSDASQVGAGAVAIFPTFKGFRRAVTGEASASVKGAAGVFGTGFSKAGADAGAGFRKSFAGATAGVTSAALKSATADVAKSSRELSAARLKEQDATGKVRVAEALLADARRRSASDSAQVVRAEERLSSAQRAHVTTMSSVVGATDRLSSAQRNLASATRDAATSATGSGGAFARLPSIFGRSGAEGASSFGSSFRTGFGQVFAGATLANIATGALSIVGQAAGAALSSGISYGLQSVNLASDLEQSTGAVEAVFKDQAGVVLNFSSKAATGVGLARGQYQKFAIVVGAQLKNLGLPFDQVAGKTDDLITLGADLAAQFGGETSTAVSALSSLLRGERDPIEQFGVGLKQVDIDARKAALGLDDLTGEADKQAEIQATLSLLWEQTADAQGTFFRESDTYAHKQQVLNAQLEESKAKLGEALLPAFSAAATFANETLIPALDGIIGKVGPELKTALEDAGPKFEELAGKAGTLLEQFLSDGAEALPGFVSDMSDLATSIGLVSDAIKLGLDPNSPPASFLNDLSTNVANAGKEVRYFFNPAARRTDENPARSQEVTPEIRAMFENGAKSAVDYADGFASQGPYVTGAGDRVKDALYDAVNGDGAALYAPGETAGVAFATGVGSKLPDASGAGASLLGGAAAGAGGGAGVAGGQDPVLGTLLSIGEKVGGDYATGVGSKRPDAEAAGSSLRDGAATSAGGGYGPMLGAGENAGDGYAQGIRNRISAGESAAKDLAAAAYAAAQREDDSHSPSRKYAKLGGYGADGYALGIRQRTFAPVAAMRDMAAATQRAASMVVPVAQASGSTGAPGVIPRPALGREDVPTQVTIVTTEQNPRVSGRVVAQEFLRGIRQ